jgi:hypothetical protein
VLPLPQDQSEAKAALMNGLRDRDNGSVPASKMSVSALLDEWLDELADTVSS